MVAARELVRLLYRADWTTLSLSGKVTGTEPVTDFVGRVESQEPPGWPWRPGEQASRPSWSFEPGGEGTTCALFLAPGGRFRAEDPDGEWSIGCDGTRTWHWLRERPPGMTVSFGLPWSRERQVTPYRSLLAPSWLLAGYALAVTGEVRACGRAGVRVVGTPRAATERTEHLGRPGQSTAGGMTVPFPRWPGVGRWDEVDAVVDAELGILLRCSKRVGDRVFAVAGFTSLEVPSAASERGFAVPPGGRYSDGGDDGAPGQGEPRPGGQPGGSLADAVGEALGAAGKEAAKTVAGMAAGGLGALIRYAPRRRADPFTQATAEGEDPERAMPADETPPEPGGEPAAGLPDDVLHLLYRGGIGQPSLRATLHQWADVDAAFDAVPPSVRGTGFGGVGFLVDAVRESAQAAGSAGGHAIAVVAVGGWRQYRIDITQPLWEASRPGRGGPRDEASTIANDGDRRWQVYPDRVLTGRGAPPPADLANLLDPSWLLDRALELSGGAEVRAGGRRGYRVVVTQRGDTKSAPESALDLLGLGPRTGGRLLARLAFPAVAVVDAETGHLLRLTRFKGGRSVLRQELRDVTPLEPGASFAYTPPDGLPVQSAGGAWSPPR